MIDMNYVCPGTYTKNSLGYRAPEFETVNWSNSYIIQGCSAVYGLGIDNDADTVGNQLSLLLGKPVINLGIPGGGIELQYWNTIYMLENNIKPLGVFIIYPNIHRYVLFNEDGLENVGPWYPSDSEKLDWMLSKNSKQHNLWDIRAYQLMWKQAGVPVYEFTHHKENTFCTDQLENFLDWGTDNEGHWGPITANHVANRFYMKVKEVEK